MLITEIKENNVADLRRGTLVEMAEGASPAVIRAVEGRAPLGWERISDSLVAEIWDGSAESLRANRQGAIDAAKQFMAL